MITEVQLTVTNLSSVIRTLDLYEEDVVAINWRFTDLLNLTVAGSYSKQFRVPNTPNNNEIFGSIFNPNASPAGFSFHQKVTADLRVSTIPITQGHIQLKQVVTKLGSIHEYEIVFFAETPDLSRAIGSKKIADLDFTAITHEINYDNVITETADYIYALTDRGYKWSEVGEVGSRPISNLAQPVYPNELTPCLNGLWIFDKIMSEAGFAYSGSEIQTELERYWMPCANEKYTAIDNEPQQFLFRLGRATDATAIDGDNTFQPVPSLTEDYDNNGDVSAGVYTVPFTGWFKFRVWATITATGNVSNGGSYRIRLRQTTNGNTIGPTITQFINNANEPSNIQYTTQDVFLGQGQTVRMEYLASTMEITIEGNGTNNPSTGTGWELVSTGNVIAGEDISWSKNVPDMLQIDFIKSIISMHNLVVIPDRTIENTLVIRPIVDYFEDGVQKDWTAKLDLNKDQVLLPTTEFQSKKLKFTYTDGADVGSQLYVTQNRIYGDYIIDGYTVNSGDIPNDFAQGDLVIDLKFQSIPAIDIEGTSIALQKFVNETGEFQRPKPCLLYLGGTADIALYDDDILSGVLTTVNILSNYENYIPTTLFDDDLNWSVETDLYYHNIKPYNNLFNRYYRDYLNELYSPNARILDAYFVLSNTDILNFKFNDQIFIVDSYWRILEIFDYDFGRSDSTKVRLIKVVDIELDCALIPASVNVTGTVSWVNSSGSPTAGTQVCCERYGWFWNGSTNLCSTISGVTIERRRSQTQSNTNRETNSNLETSVVRATGSTISGDTVQSLLLGTNINIEDNNPMSTAVGDSLRLIGDQRGSAMFGKNVYANLPGIHIGGGWYEDDRELADGCQQSGVIMYSGAGDYAATGNEISMTIDGIKNKHLTLVDDTMWACELSLAVLQSSAGVMTSRGQGLFIFDLYKTGGITSASAVKTVYESSGHGTYLPILNTATDTSQCRITLRSSGGTYPYNGMNLVFTLRYTQIRILS